MLVGTNHELSDNYPKFTTVFIKKRVYLKEEVIERNHLKQTIMKENGTYFVQDWTIHPELNLLKNHQSELLLKPRLMRLLDYFIQHPNKIITKDELLDYVWDGRMVTENLLTKSISELRKLLKENFEEAIQIETLRNVGYRLQITEQDLVSSTPELAPVIPLEKKKSVASEKTFVWHKSANVLWFGIALLALLAFGIWSKPATVSYDIKHHKITSLKGLEMKPAVSPDGKNIAFSWRKDLESSPQIYVRGLEATTPRKLNDSEQVEFNPIWSSDGQHIVFLRQLEGQGFQLVKKSVIGIEEMVMGTLDFDVIDNLLWLKNEKRLLFMARATETDARALFCFDVATTKVEQLTHPPKEIYGDIFPTYTGMDDEVAFIRADYGEAILSNAAPTKGQLMILNLKTKKVHALAAVNQEINSFLYVPSMSRYLCWVTEQLGEYTILAFDKEGQQSVIGKTTLGLPKNASVIKDHKICYEYWKSSVDIHAYSILDVPEKVSKSQAYLNSTSWDWGLSFATKSKQAAFFSQRDGYTEIWLTDTDRPENARQLTHLESPLLKSLALSPDGQQLVFASVKNNQTDLFLLVTNGQDLQQITNSTANYAAPEWSTDGQSIYYASTASGDWELYAHDLITNKVEQLTTGGGFRALPAPNETDILYFVKYKEDGLWRYDQQTKKTELVAVLPETSHSTNWAVSETGVYYLTWRKGVAYVDYYDFNTKQNKTVTMLKDMLAGLPALALSPDLKQIFVAKGSGLNADILGLEFLEKK